MSELLKIENTRVLRFPKEGAMLQSAPDADRFMADAFAVEAELLAIPVARLGADFLRLSTGVAGEIFQRFVNYRLKCAIFGDLTAALNDSQALRDFVYEANQGQSIWFVPDFEHLRRRLAGSR